MSSIEKAMQRQAEKKKFGQKKVEAADVELEKSAEESLESESAKSSTAEAVESDAAQEATQSEVKKQTVTQSDVDAADNTPTELKVENEQIAQEVAQTELADTPSGEQAVASDLSETEEPEAKEVLVPVSKDLHINTAELEEKGFVALSKKRTLINEEFRSIKRKVLTNAFGPLSKTLKHSNLVLVSSSRPNEGKTFTAVNLALSMALEQDKTVLLVDADVLKPSVSKTLNIGANVGLIEYLTGEVESVGDVIYHTNIENLKVLPAGLPHHLSNELLSSDKMQQLFEEFATRYPDRVVVFDCPPLLGVNETALMAAQCGQGVIVVEELRSKVSEVKKATELLPEEMAVGFVLNKVVETNDADSYGYGYYYSTGE